MTPIIISDPKFHMGELVITRSASEVIKHNDYSKALQRHLQCDWGDLCKEDMKANDDAFKNGGRLFSSYTISETLKFWIITEADKSVTTILLPEDY